MGETVPYISNELNSHNLRKGVAVDFKITLQYLLSPLKFQHFALPPYNEKKFKRNYFH